MEFLKNLKKAILGHESVELADVLQIALLVAMVALLLFIALKSAKVI